MSLKERHRGVLACARCYQKKKKCDKRIPSCTRCLQASQPCIGLNRQKDVEVPRSILQYLEHVLDVLNGSTPAQSVVESIQHGQLPQISQSEDGPSALQQYHSVVQLARCAVASTHTILLLHNQTSLYHRNRLFYGSESPPLKIDIGILKERPYQIRGSFSGSRPPASDPMLVPIEVARLLLKVYIDNILPRHPCFMDWELKKHFNDVYPEDDTVQDRDEPSEMSRFIIDILLAISCLTSKAHDFRKIASLSKSLHRDALRYSQFLRHSNISSLRCFLLLIQLAILIPHVSNLWYLTGEAMRMAIELGLHQESTEPLQYEVLDLRRRIFWTTYILERTVCLTSGCPMAIGEEHINVQLPYKNGNGSSNKSQWGMKLEFLRIIRTRQLQSDIHAIQFFGHKLPESTTDYANWILAVDQEIGTWEQGSLSDSNERDWFANEILATRLILHRPCLRNPTPLEFSTAEVVKTAIGIINGAWKLLQTGYLVFPFHNVYQGFHAGLVLLYSTKHRSETCQAYNLHVKIVEALNLLSRVFTALVERWPAAMNTSAYFDELKEGVLRNIESPSISEHSVEDVNLIAELDHLVTERQTSGSYCRQTSKAHIVESPDWLHMPPFQLSMDESWESFLNMGFGYDVMDVVEIPEVLDDVVFSGITPHELSSVQGETINGSITLEKVESIIESISSCNYCRNRRVKCSRTLPACRACADSSRICVYYDTILLKDIPGSHLNTLYTNIKNKLSHEGVIETEISGHRTATATVTTSPVLRNILISYGETVHKIQAHQPLYHIDKLFFGVSSSLAALNFAMLLRPNYLKHQSYTEDDPPHLPTIDDHHQSEDLQQPDSILPSCAVAKTLIEAFSQSMNTFYPTIQHHTLEELLAKAYNESDTFHGTFEEQTLYIVLGIGSLLTKSNHPSFVFTPSVYFTSGVSEDSIMHEKTSTSQVLLLQRCLLTCIYLLLDPGAGDIWRNLGLAIRLYFDIVHRPSYDEREKELALMLYRTLYCLECQVAIAYGRPSLLAVCDVLRENMLTAISGTLSERISIQFYRISFLKLQILNEMLCELPRQRDSNVSVVDQHNVHREKVQTWFEEWLRESESFDSFRGHHQSTTTAQLAAWGQLHYHECILLLSKLYVTEPVMIETTCDNFIKACTTLARNSEACSRQITRSSMPIFFPISWTTTHSIFTSALSLFHARKFALERKIEIHRQGVLRRCLALMASLEANANNMAGGFTEILERLCSSEEN